MRPTLITSRTNPRVKQLRGAFAGQERMSGGLAAIEGEHLLREAIRSGLAFKTAFFSTSRGAPDWLPGGIEQIELGDEVFASAVETRSPQGIAALVVPPVWRIEDAFAGRGVTLLLVAVELQDPGNLGTLVRSAEAFGAAAVLTTHGTVSEWNQKALRASAGSVFRVPVVEVTRDELRALKSRGVTVFAAVAPSGQDGDVQPAADTDLNSPCALMIGNEGAGLGDEWLSLADARITIPTPGQVESLNAAVAGSLLLYEASRQRSGRLPHGRSISS